MQKLPRNCYIDVDGKIYSPAGPDHDYAATDTDVAHLLRPESLPFPCLKACLKKKLERATEAYDWRPIEKLIKQEKDEKFARYLDGALPDADKLSECLDSRLQALGKTKAELRAMIDANPGHRPRITEVCTDQKTFDENWNLRLEASISSPTRRRWKLRSV